MGVLTSSWYYLALKGEREFAKILGKTEDVEMITKMMDQLAETFDAVYWTGSAYRSADYTGETDDRSQAMAVVSGLASADKYPALVKVLKKEYHASPYMEKYVLESLFMMNEPEFALERMKNRYTKMLEYKDYTTLFEGWGIGSEGFGGGTINHAWSGGPLTLLSQKVCGIEPTSPGFRSFKVTPQLGSLKEASASLETHYGMIRVSLKKKGNKAAMILEVPAGTQAEVKVGKNKMKVLSAGTHKMDILLK
jgi:glycogen debranching enzyme